MEWKARSLYSKVHSGYMRALMWLNIDEVDGTSVQTENVHRREHYRLKLCSNTPSHPRLSCIGTWQL